VELQRRLSKGLYFQASYVFSTVMTDYGTGIVPWKRPEPLFALPE
jgi:hypothetical protein